MNLYLRLLLIWFRNRGQEKHMLDHRADSTFRVWPNDIDAFGHMNNGRYLQIMDVARVEWMLQTPVANTIRQQRWAPLLGGGVIRFRHSLKLAQRYSVHTRLLGWDTRWFYLEHSFRDRIGRCVAVGVTRAGLRRSGQWVPADEVMHFVEPGTTSPLLPAHILDWNELEEQVYRHGAGRRQLPQRSVRFSGLQS
ncbi:MAG: thioesterase family protein [Pseudomonadota bacterium]